MTCNQFSEKGFSLIELTVSIALLVGISSLVFVSFNALNNKQALDKQVDFIESAVNKTRTDALNSKNGVDQTFSFSTNAISYNSQTINLESGITLQSNTTGANSITFYRLTGFPSATGTLVYQLKKGNTVIATSSVTINNLGIIE